ncbi:putative zinc-binding metallopeptidase [Flavimarina sp. Hel_I_48]|uniref:zinc-binding metallopeptidase family protein n=1 Tax=Flavimarina sp. Hel_I_48 TaxID=1392488 RepID=UPI0004DEDE22|nr:putative zinc-binding metallopeptidase [Flavimarina sp. Hel_I_48]
MKLFQCTCCKNAVFFENSQCIHCENALAYLPQAQKMITASNGSFEYPKDSDAQYVYCVNHEHQACNWLVKKEEENIGKKFCVACQLNHTIPNLTKKKNLRQWRKIEGAKHRLIYSLQRFNLPLNINKNGEDLALSFDFLAPQKIKGEIKPVMTGHLHGLITINIKEANAVHRESMKEQMKERYRTVLGHFRHEVGHFYWEVLIRGNSDNNEAFTTLFGDANQDYGEALQEYYKNGAAKNWRETYISKYASSHPWEDWAETWAHYMHIIDTLETAYSFGIKTRPKVGKNAQMDTEIDFDPYLEQDFSKIINRYIKLTFALNSLNRSMGQPDLYAFVLTAMDIEKLKFVHKVILKNQ